MVGASGVTPGPAVLIRPKRTLLRSGVLSVVIGGIPLFGVLYWLSISQGSWHRVLAIHVAFMLCCLFAWLRFRGGFLRVDEQQIVKQAFFHRTVVNRSDVATIVIARTYRGSSPDTIPQFLALDASGTRLLRLRGIYWSLDDMHAVAEAIGAVVVEEPVAMTLSEYYELHPGIAYWYEGRPWVALAGIVVALVLAGFTVVWLLMAIGTPVAYSLG